MEQFKINNVKCQGCVNTITKSLQPDFGDIHIELQSDFAILTLKITEDKIQYLRDKLINLGYPMHDENLSMIENITTTTKSYISCAIGKLDKKNII